MKHLHAQDHCNSRYQQLILKCLYVLLLSFVFSSSNAANKALLIGTGEYKNPAFNLTGIDLDINTMINFARKIGFKSDEIRTLSKEQVTLENINNAFTHFLAKGTRPEDTLLIYYSGHGVQVSDKSNDEPDDRDEALTLYNLAQTSDGYAGLLLDDEIEKMLATLPSENIIMIIDACHSGTATRSIGEPVAMNTLAYGPGQFQSKALPFRGSKAKTERGLSVLETRVDNPSRGVVTLSAAQDDEQALATRKGSTFTLALSEALELSGHNFTPKAIVHAASNIIRERIDRQKLFRPNLSGDTTLFNKDLTITPTSGREMVNWNGMLDMLSGLPTLDAVISSSGYAADDLISLQINAPGNGYINVVAVDHEDSMVLLYPNQFSSDNRVNAGRLELPGKHDFEWAAQAPWGQNLIVTLFTTERVNLFESSLQKNQAGDSTTYYALPSLEALQQLGYGGHNTAPEDGAGAALFFDTCEIQQTC